MAVVLILRPWGLLGRSAAGSPIAMHRTSPRSFPRAAGCVSRQGSFSLHCWRFPGSPPNTRWCSLIDMLVFALFAASLHLLMGPAGMASFGHAAYFGLGAYGAASLLKKAGMPMEAAVLLGPALAVAGRGCVRLVLRAALRHLPRDADARVRTDHLVGGLSMGPAHRRLERHDRHLASLVAGSRKPRFISATLLVCVAGAARLALARVLAVRLRSARLPRRPAARRSPRHRRRPAAVERVRRRGRFRGHRGLGVRILQGQHLARDAFARRARWMRS